jgi:lipopolysaccharide transport system permease protein
MSARASRGFLAHLNPIGIVRDLFRHRELLWQFTQRNFHLRHKGSYLGLVWAVLNPLLLLSVYFTLFGLTLRVKFGVFSDEKPTDTALAILIGLTIYNFFGEVIAQAPALIVGQSNLVKKVVFPLEVLPAASLGASFFNFAISLGLVVLGLLAFGRGVPASVVWVPVIVLPVMLLGVGLGWFLSAVGVFFRDITQVIPFIMMLLQFASAVFYPSTSLPARLWAVLRFNPIIHAIELLRSVMLWQQPVNFLHLGWLYATGIGVCLLGYACFASLRPSFADVL